MSYFKYLITRGGGLGKLMAMLFALCITVSWNYTACTTPNIEGIVFISGYVLIVILGILIVDSILHWRKWFR